MKATIKISFFFLFILACNQSKNYKEAYCVNISGQKYIKLLGTRKLMVHSPADAFSSKYYLDSVLIPVPSFVNGRIDGKNIPVAKGYYSFQGSIAVKDGNLKVDLLINDTIK